MSCPCGRPNVMIAFPLVASLFVVWATAMRQRLSRADDNGTRRAAGLVAYVPSGPAYPHGRTHAASNRRHGHLDSLSIQPGAHIFLPQRHVHMPAMAGPSADSAFQPDFPLGSPPAPRPGHAALDAKEIVNAWQSDARISEEWAGLRHDGATQRGMWNTQKALYAMRRGMNAAVPDYVFALTKDNAEDIHAEDIQAMATVTADFNLEGGGRKGAMEVLHIGALAARPTAENRRGVVAGFMRKLIHVGASTSRLVSISQDPACNDYYESLGFEPKGQYWPYDVLNESGLGEPSEGFTAQLVTLEHVPRHPGDGTEFRW